MENKPKILIVDDDKFLLNMYSIKFAKSEFEVNTANSSDDALGKIEGGFIPDIILLDIIMPGLDGFGFLQAFRERKLAPSAAIVMLTNQGQLADIERAKVFNVDGYIIKATTIPSEVVEEVKKIFSKTKQK